MLLRYTEYKVGGRPISMNEEKEYAGTLVETILGGDV